MKVDVLSLVVRGGTWYTGAQYARSAPRHRVEPGGRYANLGFRLVVTAE